MYVALSRSKIPRALFQVSNMTHCAPQPLSRSSQTTTSDSRPVVLSRLSGSYVRPTVSTFPASLLHMVCPPKQGSEQLAEVHRGIHHTGYPTHQTLIGLEIPSQVLLLLLPIPLFSVPSHRSHLHRIVLRRLSSLSTDRHQGKSLLKLVISLFARWRFCSQDLANNLSQLSSTTLPLRLSSNTSTRSNGKA